MCGDGRIIEVGKYLHDHQVQPTLTEYHHIEKWINNWVDNKIFYAQMSGKIQFLWLKPSLHLIFKTLKVT